MVRGRGNYGGGGYNSSGRGGSSGSGRGGSSYRGVSSTYYNNRSSGGGGGGSSSRSSNSFGNSHSRGNYSSSSSYNNYNSKSRDRISNSKHQDRHDEHKRPYRGSSSRDRSSERKRTRHEDTRVNSNYSSSSSYRRNEPSRNSRHTPPMLSSSASRVSTSYRNNHRDDTTSLHRNSNHQNDSMGPPKSLPPRSRIVRSSRGVINTRLRGSVSTRPHNVRLIRTRRDATDMQIMRKKLLLAHQRDRARRIKIARLTSSLRKRRDVDSSHRKISTSSSSTRKSRGDKNDDSDDRTSKTDELEDKRKSSITSSIKIKSEKMDDDEDNNDEQVVKEGNVIINNKKGEELDKDSKLKEDKDEKSDAEGSDNDGKSFTKKHSKDNKIDDRESKSKSPRKMKRSFIKLTCVHCRTKCLTFQEYSNHLYYRVHKGAMRRLALRQKAQLSQMRLKQRNAQRDIEHNSKEDIEDCKPQFCLLCRLNYRQAKAKHQLSEHHRNMKKFLMPYCSTCHIAFKSPMMYEAHRCSLEHIKRKARNNESHSENSGDEKEVDLTNFMTVDSVGEIDGAHNDIELDDENIEEDEKDKVNVGADHVKKTEAFYCDLCRIYFQCKDDDDSVLKKHCSTRSHLKAFIRFKEDQDLQAEAERVQRKESSKDKKKSDEINDKIAQIKVKNEEHKKNNNIDDTDETGEDKLWEDVDKDLGDLLREVGPEDDEEDGSVLNIDIERFDKFKNSEKAKAKELNGTSPTTDTIDNENIPKEEPVVVVKNKKDKIDINIKTEDVVEASV